MLIASLICGCWRAAVVPCSSAGISYQWAWSRSQATLLGEKVVKEIMAYICRKVQILIANDGLILGKHEK